MTTRQASVSRLIHIRSASEADIPEMHRIRMSVRQNQLADAARIQPQDYRSMLNVHGRGWVAEIDSQIVGFAVADLARSNVWALFVDPAFEGCGVGRQLHDTMLESFFATGTDAVWLTTEPGTRAAAFYLAAHWQYAGVMPNGEARFEMSRDSWAAATRLARRQTADTGKRKIAGLLAVSCTAWLDVLLTRRQRR